MKPMADRVAYHTVKGRRATNQDAVVVGVMSDGRSVAAVADGMGGRLAGDVASRRALEVVVERLGSGEPLPDAVKAANRTLFEESNTDPELHGMGTTVVALLQNGESYIIANVGDSRAYRLSGEGITKVTADHSFTAEAVEAGDMTAEDAVHSPWANALTRAIGTDPDVDVDIFGPFDAHESHAILLCSDGFHKPLSDDGILNSVLGCKAEDAGEELTDIALRAGSDDNITIALVSFGDDSWRDEAIRARNDGWDMDDAPTIEFESEEDGWVEPEQEPAAPSPEPAKREGRPQPEWILPEPPPEADGREPPADGLIESGFIGETMAPVRPTVSRDLSAVEVLAHIDGKMAAQGPAAAPAGESQQTPTGPGDPADGEEARSEGGAETPGSKASKPESSRRSRDSGFRLVVSPAKPQRRFGPRALLAPMVLLAVIGVVVAALIGLL